MNDIKKTIKLLQETSSTNAKKQILIDNESPLLKRILEQAYNHFITFGITNVDDSEINYQEDTWEGWYENMFMLLKSLEKREYTGHEARDRVLSLLGKADREDGAILLNILKKDLRIGVGTRLINKAYPNLLPEAFCQTASKYDPKKVDFPVYVDTKLDGIRCIGVVGQPTKLFSRNGKEFHNYTTIEQEIALLGLPHGERLDGEVTMGHFQDLMKTMGKTDGVELAKDAIYNIFDIQNTELSFEDRLKLLSLIKVTIETKGLKHVRVIDGFIIENEEELKTFYEKQLADGEEGAMIKILSAPYEMKRSKAWQKLKPEHTEDIEIIDFEEGRGKYVGELGAFICKLNDKDETVRVGSGLDDDQREELWNRREELVGTFIEVKYQEKTRDGSLRFPVFMRFRKDKS